MTKKLLITALVALSSLPAFAGGGSSIGPSACSFAPLECHTGKASSEHDPDVLNETWVCVFNGNASLYAVVAVPNHEDIPPFQDIVETAPQSGDDGAPYIYSNGSEFTLNFVSGAADQPGYLTIPSLDFDSLAMTCKAN